MSSGAPIGNKNAEIWTFELSDQLLDKAIGLTDNTYHYIVSGKKLEGYEFDFIGEIARELGVYRDLMPRDIPRRFPELREKVHMLISRLESNCYSNTKKGLINTATGIINLKSNHGWTDRLASDHTTNGKDIQAPITWIDSNEATE